MKQARYFLEDLGDGVMLEMIEIPAGYFMMGSSDSEAQVALADARRYDTSASLDRLKSELPKHLVVVPGFYIGRFEVAREQWRQVARLPKVGVDLNEDPSYFKDSWQQPVERVSWAEAVEFCERLRKKTGRPYRLPTEAEWEYAARASTTTPFAFGETITSDIVNCDGNYPYAYAPKGVYRNKTTPVGNLGLMNPFGLFDMHGNVWEWCLDLWHDSYNGAATDGSAWLSNGEKYMRSTRGGSWYNDGWYCRSSVRYSFYEGSRFNYIGFRVVVSARIP